MFKNTIYIILKYKVSHFHVQTCTIMSNIIILFSYACVYYLFHIQASAFVPCFLFSQLIHNFCKVYFSDFLKYSHYYFNFSLLCINFAIISFSNLIFTSIIIRKIWLKVNYLSFKELISYSYICLDLNFSWQWKHYFFKLFSRRINYSFGTYRAVSSILKQFIKKPAILIP